MVPWVTQSLRPKFGSPSPPKMSDVAIEMCHPSAGVLHRQADPQASQSSLMNRPCLQRWHGGC